MAAHPPLELDTVVTWWTWDPVMLGVLGTAGTLYGRGLYRLWRRAGTGRGIRRLEAAAYAAGLAVIAVALFSPIDRLSDLLFSAHMSQHELLMSLAAPLIVFGRPLVPYFWGLPRRARAFTRSLIARPNVRLAWRCCTAPVFVLAVHGIVRWIWHVPVLFEAAMRHEALHAVQHATFFGSAALFWWALVHGRYGKVGYGVSLLFVFATALHTSVLGAIITLAPRVLYPIYRVRFGGSEAAMVEDQGLAGLIMWVPSGLAFLVAGLALFTAWLGESERRATLRSRLTRRGISFEMPGGNTTDDVLVTGSKESNHEKMEEAGTSGNPHERRDRRLPGRLRTT